MRLDAYLPGRVVEALDGGARLAPGSTIDVTGTACFVDLAGFTPMTELFAAEGPSGTEALTLAINDLFTPLIDHIAANGGDVVCFAGDSMTLVFDDERCPADAPGGADATTRRAIRTAEDLIRLVGPDRRIRRGGDEVALRVKVGVASGAMRYHVVGLDDIRCCILTGDAVDRAGGAEHLAEPGQVAVDATASGSGAVHVYAPGEAPVAGLRPAPVPLDERAADDRIAPFLHSRMAERIRLGGLEHVDEHRRVTTVFVRLDIDESELHPALTEVIRLAERSGGFVCQTDAGDKGVKALTLFGAPLAERDPELRAAAFAAGVLRSLGAQATIGATTGTDYVGQVGSARRRQYTALGDSVNLAARLMQAATPGTALADPETVRSAGEATTWTVLDPIRVKGRTEPITPHALDSVRLATRAADAPDVLGRDHVLADLTGRAARATSDGGELVLVHGPQGIGRSALVRALRDRMGVAGAATASGAADLYDLRGPYGLWHDVVADLLELSGDAPADEIRSAIADLLDPPSSADTDRWLAEVTVLMGGPIAVQRDPEVARRAAEVRAELFVDLLAARSRRSGRLTITLDDVDRADDASLALLGHLVRHLPRLAVMVVATATDPALVPALAGLPRVDHVELPTLDADASDELVRRRWDASHSAPLRRRVADSLVRAAGGNPLLLQTLVDIQPDDDAATAVLPAPTLTISDLETLALTLVDRLPEGLRLVLRRASVLGGSFRTAELSAESAGQAAAPLAALVERGMLARHRRGYSFVSEGVRDAVYRSLSERTRRALHLDAGRRLEEMLGDRAEDRAEALARHFAHSDDTARQLRYFFAAADRAWAAFDLDATETWLERLVDIAPHERLPEVQLRRATVVEHAGRWDEAQTCLADAVTSPDALVRVRALAQLGLLIARTSSWADAQETLTAARQEAEECGDLGALVEILDVISMSACALGELDVARDATEAELAAADQMGDVRATSLALSNLGQLALAERRFDEAAEATARARRAASQVGDERLLCEIDLLAGAIEQDRGDLLAALAHYRAAGRRAERVRLSFVVASAAGNEAELRLLVGDLEGARSCASFALRGATDLGDLQGVVSPLGILAEVALARDDLDQSRQLLARVVDVCGSTGDRWFEAEALATLARLERRAGDRDAARRHLDVVGEFSEGANPQADERVKLLRILLDLDHGADPATVSKQLGALVDELSDPLLQLEAEVERWRLDPDPVAARRLAVRCRTVHLQAPEPRVAAWFEELVGHPIARAAVEPTLPPVAAHVSTASLHGAGALEGASLDPALALLDALVAPSR